MGLGCSYPATTTMITQRRSRDQHPAAAEPTLSADTLHSTAAESSRSLTSILIPLLNHASRSVISCSKYILLPFTLDRVCLPDSHGPAVFCCCRASFDQHAHVRLPEIKSLPYSASGIALLGFPSHVTLT